MRITIYGTDRQEGAIGTAEPFAEIVDADSVKVAVDITRDRRYGAKREHVHIKQVAVDSGNTRLVTLEEVTP